MSGPLLRILAALAAAALVLGGCGTVTPDSLAFVEEEVRPGETVIRLATYTNLGISGAIEQWEREHPTATVVIDRRSFDDHHSTILEPRADTITPDVVAFDASYSARFRDRPDLLVDLRGFGSTKIQATALPWRWAQGVADDGRVIGIPVDVGAMALAYRADLVSAEIGEGLDGMESWCDLLVAGDAYSDVTTLPFLPQAADIFDAVLGQSAVRFYDAERELIHDANPAVHRAWDIAMRSLGEEVMFDDPCPDAEGIDRFSANMPTGSDQWKEAVRDGGVAAVMATAEVMGEMQATAPETSGTWRVVNLPEGGAAATTGLSLAAHADSPSVALAVDLIAYLAEESTQLRAFGEFGRFPAAATLYTDDELVEHRREFFGDSRIGAILIESAVGHPPAPDGPDLRVIQREFRGAVSRVESGTQTPEDAWNEALWRIVRVLD